MPSNQKQIIEQVKFPYSPLGKAFQKQIKTIEDQGEKQINAIQNQGQIKTTESNKGVDNELHKVFDELSYERTREIKDLRRKINFNNLTYLLYEQKY